MAAGNSMCPKSHSHDSLDSPNVGLSKEKKEFLSSLAAKLCGPGKGLLAADESTSTIGKRFQSIGVSNTEENRRAYRSAIVKASGGCSSYISGIILYDETMRQSSSDGKPFTEELQDNGISVGLKVDTGLYELPNGESVTQGLDDLGKRLSEASKHGVIFAKWRAVYKIGSKTPSESAVEANAEQLALYASVCQDCKIVPVIEPEILSDGTHDIETCLKATVRVITSVYTHMIRHGVYLEGTLLKPNMVTPGSSSSTKASPTEIAVNTITAMKRSVPPSVPGLVFLSGGQSEEEATENLDAMNKIKDNTVPWALSFSYGRALQSSALKTCGGVQGNIKAAQDKLIERAKANSMASIGKSSAKVSTSSGPGNVQRMRLCMEESSTIQSS